MPTHASDSVGTPDGPSSDHMCNTYADHTAGPAPFCDGEAEQSEDEAASSDEDDDDDGAGMSVEEVSCEFGHAQLSLNIPCSTWGCTVVYRLNTRKNGLNGSGVCADYRNDEGAEGERDRRGGDCCGSC